MKPLEDWNEEYILDLPSGENDRFDRKGSQVLIDCSTGPGSDKKRTDLSCDVSAFANSGGGFLIFGVSNAGTIDGGVSSRLKPSGTYDWLDAVVGDLVEPVLRGYRIKEILPDGTDSKIKPGSAIYVLSIPDSEDAPHQAKDAKYYLRLNAHNYAARHRQIEDIRGRPRHPLVDGFIEFEVGGQIETDYHRGTVAVMLWPVCHLSNVGRVTARDVSLVFSYPKFSQVKYTPVRNLVQCDADSDRRHLQLYLAAPLHPGQNLSIYLGEAHLVFEYGTLLENNTKSAIRDINFPSTLYVENAPPIEIDGRFSSNRVSGKLRHAFAKKYDWQDRDEGSYS